MGHGGARYGAGRPGWHAKAEQCRSIRVGRWRRDGLLVPGAAGIWTWTDANTGVATGSIAYTSTGSAVMLGHIAADGTPIQQWVPILRVPCNFGGDRSWFGCPHCGRPVAALYVRASGFGCRRCAQVAYRSQSENATVRELRRRGWWGVAQASGASA